MFVCVINISDISRLKLNMTTQRCQHNSLEFPNTSDFRERGGGSSSVHVSPASAAAIVVRVTKLLSVIGVHEVCVPEV